MAAHGHVIPKFTLVTAAHDARQMSWTGNGPIAGIAQCIPQHSSIQSLLATLFPTSRWVRPSIPVIAKVQLSVYRCTRPRLGRKGRPGHIHGLPHDGVESRKGACESLTRAHTLHLHALRQWVNDVADAGGALYCFHIEATCMYSTSTHHFAPSHPTLSP
jgi:hypothetical protein